MRRVLGITILIVGLLSRAAVAEESAWKGKLKSWLGHSESSQASPRPLKKEGECFNAGIRGWRLVSRIDSGTYQIASGNGWIFCSGSGPNDCRTLLDDYAVLVMLKDEFKATGRIGGSLWLDMPAMKPETMRFTLQDGFEKDYLVLRESAGCIEYGKKSDAEYQAKIAAERKDSEENFRRTEAQNAREAAAETKRRGTSRPLTDKEEMEPKDGAEE